MAFIEPMHRNKPNITYLLTGRFPAQWRAASVIPIPKPGKDHSDPLSYRPIALTSCLCKILERMINQRLIWYLEKKGILNRSQCGFRKHRCTTDHLVSLERYVRDAFAHKQQAVGLFFDLEKAYETTWQYGIMRDLHRAGLRGRLPIFVSEYLKDRKFKVRVGVTLSDEFGTEEGVPTGGVLAVTCFGLKINDLPRHIPPDIFRALFVDDLAICFRGSSLHAIERHLQHAVDAIQGWALQNGFKFAAHKCKILHFTAPRRKPERQPNIMIRHVALPVEETTKFLGLWWDSKLNFGKHITEQKKTEQRSYKSSESCRPYQVGRRPRHASHVVSSNCPLQVGLWMHCIWFGIHLQPQQTQHYPQHRP